MTKEEILATKAGAKLDAFIHVTIMHKRHPEPPHYSTDISLAWGVVDKIFSGISRRLHLHQDLDNVWWAKFGLAGIFADSKNAPEAICKAALLAKLREEP